MRFSLSHFHPGDEVVEFGSFPSWKTLVLTLFLYTFFSFLFFDQMFSKVYIGLGDPWSQFYSRNVFFKNCIQQGIFPLWNPLILCGLPSGLDAVTHFSIPNILLLFMNVNVAWNANLFLTSMASGWFMFLLLWKQMKMSWPASFLGGFIFLALSVRLPPDNVAFFLLPVMFFLANHWLEKRRFIWLFVLASSISIYFLNTNPQYVFYFCLFLYLYLLMRLWDRKQEDQNKKSFLLITLKSGLPFVMAIGLSAFQILPIYELLSLSHRGGAVKDSIYGLLPFDLVQVFYPRFYFSSANPVLNFLPYRIMKGIAAIFLGSDRLQIMNAPYVGILPLLLMLTMLFRFKKDLISRFFTIFFIGILSYVVLNPLLYLGIRHVPILNKLPSVGRIYNIYYFIAAILAASAFDGFNTRIPAEGFQLSKIRKMFAIFFWVLIGVIALRLVMYLVLHFFYRRILSVLTMHVLPIVLKQSFYTASPDFYSNRLGQFLDYLKGWALPTNPHFLVPTAFMTLGLLVLHLYVRSKVKKTMFTFAVFLLSFFDLYLYTANASVFSPDKLKPMEQEMSIIKKDPGIFRVMPLQPVLDTIKPLLIDNRAADIMSIILRPETNLIYDIATPEGYRSLLPQRYARFIKLLAGIPPHGWLVGEFENVNEGIADLMNIKYVVVPSSRKLVKGYAEFHGDEKYRIYRNEDVLERAFLVHEVQVVSSEEESISLMRNIDFSREVVLEGTTMGIGRHVLGVVSSTDKVTIREYKPHRVVLDVYASDVIVLVLTDCFYPGWLAYVDGKSTPIFKANYIFRALLLDQGSHRVEFVYRPKSLKIGALISLLFLILGATCSTFLARRFF